MSNFVNEFDDAYIALMEMKHHGFLMYIRTTMLLEQARSGKQDRLQRHEHRIQTDEDTVKRNTKQRPRPETRQAEP